MAVTLPPLNWVPSPNFNQGRGGKRPTLVVLHDTEGGYLGAIATFKNSHSKVSAHLVLREDGGACTQMVKFADKAWHCKAFNGKSIGIEMAGFLAKGLGAAEWQEAAEITAYLCHRYGIPATWTKNGMQPGICRHFDLGKAGGGHMDPTQDLKVWGGFIANVQAIFKANEWPDKPWGV